MGRRHPRSLSDHLSKLPDGFLQTSKVSQGDAKVVPCVDKFRIHLQRPQKMRHRFVRLPQFPQDVFPSYYARPDSPASIPGRAENDPSPRPAAANREARNRDCCAPSRDPAAPAVPPHSGFAPTEIARLPQETGEIVVRHPSPGISGEGRGVKGAHVRIHPALLVTQRAETGDQQNQYRLSHFRSPAGFRARR